MIQEPEKCNNISYLIENEDEKYFHLYAMRVHIGKEIAKIQRIRGISNDHMAETVGTSPRNWSHLKTRDDMPISMLWRVSEVLDFDFFDLLHPIVKETPIMEEPEPPVSYKPYDKNVPKYTINFQIKYPEPLIEDLGRFMGQVKGLAHKYGFEMV